MINVSLQVRHATLADQQQIASLMFHEANMHRHLDWRSPLDWLGSSDYWVLDNSGHITGVFACPADPPQIHWIRLFGYIPNLSGPEAWHALWNAAREDISLANGTYFAAIVVKRWYQELLLSSGFEIKQNIILLELKSENLKPSPLPDRIRIRPMLLDDIEAVSKVDLNAFGLFWHNTSDSLKRAHAQAIYASVAEDDSGVIGYQLSTGNAFGAHLARLGVRTEAQGRGIGAALVSDLVHKLDPNHLTRLSVNTQADNVASLSLYKRMGFIQTGEQFPVLVYPKSS